MRTRVLALPLLLAATAATAHAQDPAPAPASAPAQAPAPRSWEPVLGFTVGSMGMDADRAAQNQVGDRSWGLQLDFGMLYRGHAWLGVDLGGQFLRDKARFTENTTGGEMQSTATVTYLSAMTGLRSGKLAGILDLGVNAGASVSMAARSIDRCRDCREDDLSIPGGAFVEPVLTIGRGRTRARLVHRQYVGGEGMRAVTSAGVEFTPRR